MAVKGRKKSKLRTFFTILIVMFYVPSLAMWIYSDKIKTGLLYTGEIKQTLNVEFLLFKDEETIYSKGDGILYRIADEGGKYAKDSEIAYVLSENSKEIITEIDDLNNRILQKQYEALENRTKNTSRLLPNLYNEEKIILDLAGLYDRKSSLIGIEKLTDDLNTSIKEKIEILNSICSPDDVQEELYKQLKVLNDRLSRDSEKYPAKEAGIISFTHDGLEEFMKTGAIDDFTLQDFEETLEGYSGFSSSESKIKVGDPVYKILVNKDIYYAFLIDEKYFDSISQLSGITIDFLGNGIIKTEMHKEIKEEDSEDILVVLKSDMYIEGAEKLRRINGELIFRNAEGIKVDIKSLVDIDDNMRNGYIFLAEANYTRLVRVRIDAYDKNFAIIEGYDQENDIKLYDTYIIDPKNIEDGQQIDN